RGQQSAACQIDAVVLVGLHPFDPHGARCIAEHRAAIQFLAVTHQRPEFHRRLQFSAARLPDAQGWSSTTSTSPTGLRGSVPPDSSSVRLSHATVCRLPQVSSPALTVWPIFCNALTVAASSA